MSRPRLGRRLGVIDIGSNSVRLVIYNVFGSAFFPTYNEKILAGLGRGLRETGCLNPEGVRDTLEALKRFRLLVGLGYSAVLTPSGRLLRRSAHPEDRPAIFAAQFALSHIGWLLTYPLSGWLMTRYGAVTALVALATLAAAAIAAACALWPKGDPEVLEHTHDSLPIDHPHLDGERRHAHPFIVDDDHPRWSSRL